jgi:membrane fusion protein (multidrug efflux system)
MTVRVIPVFALAAVSFSLSACSRQEKVEHEAQKITATTPQSKSVTVTERYVCRIHSQRHIRIRALEMGYLEAIPVKEGQKVKAGDTLFDVRPILYKTKFEAEKAEADVAQMEFNYTKQLCEDKVVSENEVALHKAKLERAKAKAMQAKAELDFATVKAPFDGIVDRLFHQQGSLVKEDEILTTLSDNSVMWVYFNVREARYFEYMASKEKDRLKIELELANGEIFEYPASALTVEAEFNIETGNIPFRADFQNPNRLLRHGQTGTILLSRVVDDAIVIPQRATFEVLQKRYVYVIDEDHVAHQREIEPQSEMEDLFVIKRGVGVNDKIVLEGVRQVRDGDKVEYEERQPQEVVAQLKYHAE